ncbi:MAG: hypothetical protein WCH75_09190 [Candidatus Binatia bacterium]|jgi:hypothetical protein
MSLVTEFIRGLLFELAPIGKWAQKHWLIIAICLITIFLIAKYGKERKP